MMLFLMLASALYVTGVIIICITRGILTGILSFIISMTIISLTMIFFMLVGQIYQVVLKKGGEEMKKRVSALVTTIMVLLAIVTDIILLIMVMDGHDRNIAVVIAICAILFTGVASALIVRFARFYPPD